MDAAFPLTQPGTPGSRPALWRNRTFLFNWLAALTSVLGDGVHGVALALWVLQSTGSARSMGIVLAVRGIVAVALGPVAGTVADRVDRRKLMIGMDLVRVLTVGALAWLMVTPGIPFPAVVALAALTTAANQFFAPAFQSSLVNIVQKSDLPRATGLLQVSQTMGHVLGPVLGGTVVALAGGAAAMAGDAASFLLSAGLILAGGAFPSPRQGSGSGSFWSEMRAGFRYVRGQPLVRGIVTLAPVVNFFANGAMILLQVIAIKVWLASDVEFGAVEGAISLGFLLGGAAVMALGQKLRRRGRWMAAAGILTGTLLTTVVRMPGVQWALPVLVALGVALAFINVLLQVALQSEVPTEMQGRVFGTMSSLAGMTAPVAFLVAGLLADQFPPVLVATISGVLLTAAMAAGFLLQPGLRDYQ